MTPVHLPMSHQEASVALQLYGDDPAFWGGLKRAILQLDAKIGWEQLLLFSDASTDRQCLSKLGVVVVEPFVDLLWPALANRLEEDVAHHPNMRIVLQSVITDGVSPEFEDLINRLIA